MAAQKPDTESIRELIREGFGVVEAIFHRMSEATGLPIGWIFIIASCVVSVLFVLWLFSGRRKS